MVDTLVNFLNKTNYSKEDFLFCILQLFPFNKGLHVGKNNNTQNEQRPKLINPFIHSQIFFFNFFWIIHVLKNNSFIPFKASKMLFFQYSHTHIKALAGEKIKYFGLLSSCLFYILSAISCRKLLCNSWPLRSLIIKRICQTKLEPGSHCKGIG